MSSRPDEARGNETLSPKKPNETRSKTSGLRAQLEHLRLQVQSSGLKKKKKSLECEQIIRKYIFITHSMDTAPLWSPSSSLGAHHPL
jgi:hypothetical protein